MLLDAKLRRSGADSPSDIKTPAMPLPARPDWRRLHRPRAWLVAVCIACLSTGCTTPKPTADRGSAALSASTILFTVRFNDAHRPDRPLTGIFVNVDDERSLGIMQFAFRPDARIPGRYTDFPVRMDLQPGRYRVQSLSGVAGGVIAAEFDVAVDLPLEVGAGVTTYLGRIDIGYTGSPSTSAERAGVSTSPTADARVAEGTLRIEMADRYDEDLPNLIRAWPSLRTRTIERRGQRFAAASRDAGSPAATPREQAVQDAQPPVTRPIESPPPAARSTSVPPPTIAGPASAPAPEARPPEVRGADARSAISASTMAGGERDAPPSLDLAAAVAAGLPAKAHAAFRIFLKSARPRAFAASDSGYHGAASGGKDVARRALINCVRASAPDKPNCRLFAVDETLVVMGAQPRRAPEALGTAAPVPTSTVAPATAPEGVAPAAALAASTAPAELPSPRALRAIERFPPHFPAEALREGVLSGRVIASITVAPDGTVSQVDIAEATPRRVFDRAVRHALLRWRFEPVPQQVRHTVEFVFKAQ